jgi:hypothetical protein
MIPPILLLSVLLIVDATGAVPPALPALSCELPKTCEEARSVLTDRFDGNRKAAERWAKKCGASKLDIVKGRILCGI